MLVLAACTAAWLPATAVAPARAQPPSGTIDQLRRRLEQGDSTANPFTPPAAPAAPTGAEGMLLAPARPVRVPGAAFALGDSVESLVQRLGLSPEGGDESESRTFAGAVQYFGQEGRGKFVFIERQLARVEVEVGRTSDRTRAFIADELTRQGYRRACREWLPDRSDCVWSGRTRIELRMDSLRVSARVVLGAGALPARPRAASPPETVTVAVEGDDLAAGMAQASPTWHPDARAVPVEKSVPQYLSVDQPNADGTVVILALVDQQGRVLDARVVSSVPMLDETALESVRKWRFEPVRVDSRAVMAWVYVPVTFPLH